MKKIQIILNGETKEVQKGLNIQELLDSMQIKSKLLVVEKNKEIVDKKDYESCRIQENDSFEVVGFFGGG